MSKPSETVLFYRDSTLNSYSQLFFSDRRGFGLLLLAITFLDPYAGFSGLLAILITILLANLLGLNPVITRTGLYSYNTLMVGLVMGLTWQPSAAYFMVLFLGTFITLVITVWLATKSAIQKVPFLSVPFIFGIWVIILSSRSIGAINLSERGVYELNELWKLGGPALVQFYDQANAWHLPLALDVYLQSLSAIVFQSSRVAGFVLVIGLLFFSRIALTLSLIGFYSGYLFCTFVQGNVADLENTHTGFNFILTAFALGGFFVVPSGRAYLLVALTAPVVSLLIGALNSLMYIYQLPIFSLPFSLLVISVVFLLQNRYAANGLPLVVFQQFAPEKNLYAYWNHLDRFRNDTLVHIGLPFFGIRRVSQGHAGGITHKEDWRFAWDFDVVDETGKTFRLPGSQVTDYYCYSLPILAPASGYVITLVDEVEDNLIGAVNLEDNWGNAIVIKHTEFLYSKITHIKKGSFKVKPGDYVHRGDPLALCGNSGRSPEPHVHFQLQGAPHIGAKTLSYPICYFIAQESKGYSLHSFEIPVENQQVFAPETLPLLRKAFKFQPGLKLQFEVIEEGHSIVSDWEVFVDAYNQSYLYCHTTGSTAYFVNNDTLHYFTSFFGDRKSLLYSFYLGAYKVLLGYYPDLVIRDTFPIEGFYGGLAKYVQDFTAPFHRYLKAEYQSSFQRADDLQHPGRLTLTSSAFASSGESVRRKIDFSFTLDNNMITGFTSTEKSICVTAQRLS